MRSEHRADYIRALQESQEAGSPEPFSSFMADEVATILRQEIDEYASDIAGDVPWIGEPATEVTPQVTPQVGALVVSLGEEELSAVELRARLELSDAKNFRALYLRPGIEAGLIEMTILERPHSRNQRYRLTTCGRFLLREIGEKES